MPVLYIGLMSGTSLDGVDGVLVNFEGQRPVVLSHQALPFDASLKHRLLSLNTAANNELHHAALAANQLVLVYAKTVQALLHASGHHARDIQAIGAHGQTVRHQPGAFDGIGYTLQLNNPSLLAELTGIDVVADFRSRDVAAGGQGAPLVPLFHHHMFAHAVHTVGVLNLGGIANLSVLSPDGEVQGFDCGPGNALLDHWCQQHTGQPFDNDGEWARRGQVIQPLLDVLLSEPFLHLTPPKSTGRDLFNPTWLAKQLEGFASASPVDVQATLTEFTARACVADVRRYAPEATELTVCGGGALNGWLMARLQSGLPQLKVMSTAERGLPPLQVEAAAFAWLARQTLLRLPGNSPKVTGAQGARILGGVFPA